MVSAAQWGNSSTRKRVSSQSPPATLQFFFVNPRNIIEFL